MRVQLHFLRSACGGGFHLIHTRVTPPPLCTLTLTFKGTGDDAPLHVIRATGRGVAAQTPFQVCETDGSMGVRVPRLCSASATLEVSSTHPWLGTEV